MRMVERNVETTANLGTTETKGSERVHGIAARTGEHDGGRKAKSGEKSCRVTHSFE